jgi:flagellar hook-associated protein 3 FlgL
MSGAPVLDDEFEIQAAHSGVATDLNIFDTLDSIIQSLATSLQSPEATAKFQNTLASAMQRLDINYNNVLTVRSSVGARLNELDALDANGALRNLNYRGQLSQLEDLDYYTASMQLELRKSALEAAALAFRKIQGTSLFNMGAN